MEIQFKTFFNYEQLRIRHKVDLSPRNLYEEVSKLYQTDTNDSNAFEVLVAMILV